MRCRLTSRSVLAAMILLALAASANACLWDYDTLAQERSRFPSVLELITGKFPRHSEAFYSWRVEDRTKRLESEPDNLELYDDLAVAYEKLGDHEKAIETILKKDTIQPGLYETHANLGTFYIHAGEYEKGLEHIEKAIEINPDAHFGREIYQKLLVEYVMSRRGDGKPALPLRQEDHFDYDKGFWKYILTAHPDGIKDSEAETEKAVEGVLGMMRFGNFDSPILLEAIGDLLVMERGGNPHTDAKRLAARAYLKASYECDDPTARAMYRKFAEDALGMQTVHAKTERELSLAALERTFRKELDDAETWYAQLVKNEDEWIASGKNPEEEFDRVYREAPSTNSPSPGFFARVRPQTWVAVGLLGVCGIIAVVAFAWRRARREDAFAE